MLTANWTLQVSPSIHKMLQSPCLALFPETSLILVVCPLPCTRFSHIDSSMKIIRQQVELKYKFYQILLAQHPTGWTKAIWVTLRGGFFRLGGLGRSAWAGFPTRHGAGEWREHAGRVGKWDPIHWSHWNVWMDHDRSIYSMLIDVYCGYSSCIVKSLSWKRLKCIF